MIARGVTTSLLYEAPSGQRKQLEGLYQIKDIQMAEFAEIF
jgi:hypothetical protein